jgi:DDE family transposase
VHESGSGNKRHGAALGNEQRFRSGSIGQYGQAGEGCSKDRDARGRCRSRLLQQRGDPRLPRGWHHSNSTKPQTSGAKSDGRFGKQDFVYLPEEEAHRCPAGGQLPYRFTSEEDGKRIRRYWTNAYQNCSLKSQCTTGPERRIPRWEHEHPLDAVQQRLDANPLAMRQRRETVEHPFGTMKARMGATHFLTRVFV